MVRVSRRLLTMIGRDADQESLAAWLLRPAGRAARRDRPRLGRPTAAPSPWSGPPSRTAFPRRLSAGTRHPPSFRQLRQPGRMIVVARREDELPWLSAETWMRRNAVRRDCPTRGGGPCGDGGEGSSRAGQGRREPAPAGRTPGQGKEPTGTGTDDGAGAPPGAAHGCVRARARRQEESGRSPPQAVGELGVHANRRRGRRGSGARSSASSGKTGSSSAPQRCRSRSSRRRPRQVRQGGGIGLG
jgi:hypothetical protein